MVFLSNYNILLQSVTLNHVDGDEKLPDFKLAYPLQFFRTIESHFFKLRYSSVGRTCQHIDFAIGHVICVSVYDLSFKQVYPSRRKQIYL